MIHVSQEAVPPLYVSTNVEARLYVASQHKVKTNGPEVYDVAEINYSEKLHAYFTDEWYYVNYTHNNISIAQRNGLMLTIPKESSSYSRDFHIRRCITMRHLCFETARLACKRHHNTQSAELQELAKKLEQAAKLNLKDVTLIIEYRITPEELVRNGDTIYHFESDTLVSLKDVSHIPEHPYAADFFNIGAFGDVNDYTVQKPDLNIKIRLIDHSAVPKKKYINIFNRVFELKPQKFGPTRRMRMPAPLGKPKQVVEFNDCVQIFYTASSDKEANYKPGVVCTTLSHEQAHENFGLYDTYEEALSLGDPKSRKNAELQELHFQIEKLKADSSIELINKKSELSRLEHELEVLKRRAEFDNQEHNKKLQELQSSILASKITQAELEGKLQAEKHAREREEFERKLKEADEDRIKKYHDDELKRIKQEHEEKLRQQQDEFDRKSKQEERMWKDQQDAKQEYRKTFLEIMKFIPATIIAMGAIAALILKMKAAPAPKTA